jgi:hypothetical protein
LTANPDATAYALATSAGPSTNTLASAHTHGVGERIASAGAASPGPTSWNSPASSPVARVPSTATLSLNMSSSASDA